jgi:hypothetical protein
MVEWRGMEKRKTDKVTARHIMRLLALGALLLLRARARCGDGGDEALGVGAARVARAARGDDVCFQRRRALGQRVVGSGGGGAASARRRHARHQRRAALRARSR